jgi:hypothetical protein
MGFGNLPPENIKKLYKNLKEQFIEYLNFLDIDKIPTHEKDDGDYRKIKYTILPKGTFLRFRSHKRIKHLEDRPIWADYSYTTGKLSFLDEDKDYSKGMEYYFGEYMNLIQLQKDLVILHWPVNYDRLAAPNIKNKNNSFNTTRRAKSSAVRATTIRRSRSVTSDIENWARLLCVPIYREAFPEKLEPFKNYVGICRDGYTMDFFYKFTGPIAKKFKEIKDKLMPKMVGFREICITNVSPATVRLISSTYEPVAEK